MLVCIVGNSGVGKTVSFATFPGKKLLLDIDDGVSSVFNTLNGVKRNEDLYVIKFYNEQAFPLDFQTKEKNATKKAPAHTENAMKLMEKYNEIMMELDKDQCVPAKYIIGMEDKGDLRVGPFQTVGIDALTNLFMLWKDAILAYNNLPELRIADYGTLEGLLFKQFIPTIKSIHSKLTNGWFIVTDHEDIEKDELTGKIYEFPIGPSRAQGRKLSMAFDEIWRMTFDGKDRMWHTQDTGRFNGAKSRLNLPKEIKPATYQRLKEILDDK